MKLAKVLIIEDDLFIRTTLSSLLESKGFNIVASVETADEALMNQKIHNPEVLLTDLDLGPGPSGIDIARELRQHRPDLGIVVLTSFSDPRLLEPRGLSLPQGTIYLTKSRINDAAVIISALLQAKHRPLMGLSNRRPENSTLSESQIEILRLVAEGHTSASIAKQRNVSEKSIEASLRRIHEQLGLERKSGKNPRIQLTRAFFNLAGKKPPNE